MKSLMKIAHSVLSSKEGEVSDQKKRWLKRKLDQKKLGQSPRNRKATKQGDSLGAFGSGQKDLRRGLVGQKLMSAEAMREEAAKKKKEKKDGHE